MTLLRLKFMEQVAKWAFSIIGIIHKPVIKFNKKNNLGYKVDYSDYIQSLSLLLTSFLINVNSLDNINYKKRNLINQYDYQNLGRIFGEKIRPADKCLSDVSKITRKSYLYRLGSLFAIEYKINEYNYLLQFFDKNGNFVFGQPHMVDVSIVYGRDDQSENNSKKYYNVTVLFLDYSNGEYILEEKGYMNAVSRKYKEKDTYFLNTNVTHLLKLKQSEKNSNSITLCLHSLNGPAYIEYKTEYPNNKHRKITYTEYSFNVNGEPVDNFLSDNDNILELLDDNLNFKDENTEVHFRLKFE